MAIYIEKTVSKIEKIVFLTVASLLALEALIFGIVLPQIGEAETIPNTPVLTLATIQGNALVAQAPLSLHYVPAQKLEMVITAYSSAPEETDSDPFITASGKYVKDGIVASNLLPFGTKVKIPELYGDKIFVVEDRMNQRKGKYQLDIWFSEKWEAKKFGAKTSYVEILEL